MNAFPLGSRSFFLLLTFLAFLLTPVLARAGTTDAKLALHAKPRATKAINTCPGDGGPAPEDPVTQGIPCSSFTTQYPVGQSADVYLVVANGHTGAGIAGLECGLDYDGAAGSGVDVFGWTLCADLDFPSAAWPRPGSGTRITWSGISNCQTTVINPYGVHAVAGAFYVYAYSDDVFYLTPNNTLESGPSAAIADCESAEYPLDELALGNVGFGAEPGCNPCTALCGPCPDSLVAIHAEDAVGPIDAPVTVANLISIPVSVTIHCTVGGVEQPAFGTVIYGGEIYSHTVHVDCEASGLVVVECRVDASATGLEGCFDADSTSFTVDCVDPRPDITSVEDIPGDQGGWVTLDIAASGQDPPPYPQLDPITRYNVWQRIEDPGKPSFGLRPLGRLTPMPAGPQPGLPLTRVGNRYVLRSAEVLGDTFPPGTWELLGSFAATGQASYLIAAPTLADAGPEGPVYSVYIVSAHTAIPTQWYVSEPDSGVSEDNLPPGMPGSLDIDAAGLLTWLSAPEPDFDYYTIYGAESGPSPPSPAVLGYTTDPFFDTSGPETPEGASYSFFQVTATDFAGNEGPPASTSKPVPVRLASFTVERAGGSAVLRWRVEDTWDHAGFRVFRGSPDGERVRLTDALLLRSGGEYEYRDELPPPEEIEYWLQEVSRSGGETWYGPARLAAADPSTLTLRMTHSRPNPFRDRTSFAFQAPRPGRVVLRILDVTGREVARPFDAWTEAGNHEAFWDGRTSGGEPAPAGVYFYDLRGDGDAVTRKLVKIR